MINKAVPVLMLRFSIEDGCETGRVVSVRLAGSAIEVNVVLLPTFLS